MHEGIIALGESSVLRDRDAFDVVVLGEDCPRPKPHPDPYQMALDVLGLLPHEALIIEDSPSGEPTPRWYCSISTGHSSVLCILLGNRFERTWQVLLVTLESHVHVAMHLMVQSHHVSIGRKQSADMFLKGMCSC